MNLYDQIENEQAGMNQKIDTIANQKADEIALQQIRGYEQMQNDREMNRQVQNENQNMAFRKGQQDGAGKVMSGLGMNPQVAQGMSQQRQPSAEDQAMMIVSEIENAQNQGASPQQLQQMIASVPEPLRPLVQQINMAKQQQPQQQMQQQAPANPIDEFAKSLLK